MHNVRFLHLNLLLSKDKEESTSFLTAQTHSDFSLPQLERPNDHQWSRLSLGLLKAKWDVTCNREVDRLGFSAIIRDDKGIVIGTMRPSRNLNATPLVVEAYGFLLTALFCKVKKFLLGR